MNIRTRTAAAAVLALSAATVGLAGCTSAADRANENLSKAADNFEVPRRIVGINGITDQVLFSVEGFCSYNITPDTIEAVCLVDRRSGAVERTTLGKADNVTFVSTQMDGVKVDMFRPRIILRPTTLIPDFDLSVGLNP